MTSWSESDQSSSWSTEGNNETQQNQENGEVIVVNKEALVENVISAGITGLASAVATRMLLGD